jgi:hypothetical protein
LFGLTGLCRCLGSLFWGHPGQAFNFLEVEPQTLGHAAAIIRLGLEEDGRLAVIAF